MTRRAWNRPDGKPSGRLSGVVSRSQLRRSGLRDRVAPLPPSLVPALPNWRDNFQVGCGCQFTNLLASEAQALASVKDKSATRRGGPPCPLWPLCLDHGALGSDPLGCVTCIPKRPATRMTVAKSLSHQRFSRARLRGDRIRNEKSASRKMARDGKARLPNLDATVRIQFRSEKCVRTPWSPGLGTFVHPAPAAGNPYRHREQFHSPGL